MTNFKKLLLAGTAVVAIGVSPAFAAGEFLFDEDNDAATAGTARDTGDTANFDTHDITFVNGPAILNVANGETIGNAAAAATAGAITAAATANGDTLTITGDADNAEAAITITGDISKGDAAGFNLIFVPRTEDSDNDESLLVDLNGNVDLGTGTLTIRSNDANNGTQSNTSTVNLSGNLTAASIVLDQDNTSSDAPTINAVLALDGSTAQAITGEITGESDGEGAVYVNNTTSTATFANNVGTTAKSVALVQVGTAAVGAVDVAAGAGNAVFNGNVDATNIGVGYTAATGASTADFNGNVVGDLTVTASTGAAVDSTATIFGNVTGAIALTDGAGNGTSIVTFDGTSAQTVTGAVTATNREGVVNVIGTGGTTFDSQIGTAGAGLGLFTVGTGSTATLKADLFTDSTNNAATAGIDVDGTLALNTTGVQVDVLEDAGNIDIDGTLSVSGTTNNATIDAAAGTLSIDGTLTTGIATAAATTTLSGNTLVSIGAASNSTVNIGNQIVLGDSATFGRAGGTNTFNAINNGTIDLDTANGIINAGGNTVTLVGTNNFTIGTDSAALTNGQVINFIGNANAASDFDGALSAASPTAVFLDTALVNLVDNASSNTALSATANILDANTVIGTNFGGAAKALTDSAVVTGGLLTQRGNLLAATSATSARSIAEGLAPTVDGAAQVGVVSTVTNSSLGITGERMASLRQDDGTGMAAGNMTHGLQLWAKAFGSTGDQDARDGVSGYDVDGYGVTVGMDTQTLAEDWVWGLAFTYADTEVDSDNVNRTNTEIDTYQIALYGDYTWDSATYINGQIGYAMNSGDQTRSNIVANVAGTTTTGSADVDSDVFFARLETGRDFDMDNGFTLTPIAMLNFQHIDTDNYSETCAAASTACLVNVDTDNMQILEAGLGAEASYLHQNADGSFLKPKLHASYRYDFIGDEVESTSNYSGLATRFTTEGFDAQQSTFNVGAGLEFYTTANWDFSVNYDYEIKEDYDGHNGYVRAAYKF